MTKHFDPTNMNHVMNAIHPDRISETPAEHLVMIHVILKSIANSALHELNDRLLDENGKPIKPKAW